MAAVARTRPVTLMILSWFQLISPVSLQELTPSFSTLKKKKNSVCPDKVGMLGIYHLFFPRLSL